MKKCPIMMASGRIGHCIEEECAWWINDDDGCAVRKLAMQNQLVDIVFSEEMTREEATEALK